MSNNTKSSPTADFGIHVVIVAIEVMAFVTVFRLTKK